MPVSLKTLLESASSILYARYERIARVGTLNGTDWQCVAIDPEGDATTPPDPRCPAVVDVTPEGAVVGMLAVLAGASAGADDRAALLALLGELAPSGLTFAPTGAVTDVATGDGIDEGADDFIAPERPLPHAAGGRR